MPSRTESRARHTERVHDRFDDVPRTPDRVGAHRAENPRAASWRLFVGALVAVVVIVGIGVIGTLVAESKGSGTAGSGATDPNVVVPIVDTTYSVLVFNGSGVSGAAETAAQQVIARGWPTAQVTTGNAAATANETIVYYASEDAHAAALGLGEIVGATDVQLNASYPFAGVPATQLTVVLGADQGTASVAPTP